MGKESYIGKITDLVKKVLFVDFIKGLRVTLGYNLSKSVTERYPDEEKWIPYRRFRGSLEGRARQRTVCGLRAVLQDLPDRLYHRHPHGG
jgi:formate hydrogenlyase subunit 6/NADH:ubiquinone oxidoreductase subunit I